MIELGNAKAGHGTRTVGGKVYSNLLGLKIEHRGVVSVVPVSGVYGPRQGDTVIGKVVDLGPAPKEEVAAGIWDRIAALLRARRL